MYFVSFMCSRATIEFYKMPFLYNKTEVSTVHGFNFLKALRSVFVADWKFIHKHFPQNTLPMEIWVVL